VPTTQVSWSAPGRVNLIGEHTDYTGGFALPFAIEAACTATVSRDAEPGELRVSSVQRDEPVRLRLDRLAPGTGGWAGYAAGVVWALNERGIDAETRPRGSAAAGLRIELDSTVPAGAGLSSSAALTCSVATAVNDLLELGLDRDDLLAVTRAAENDFVGAPTGGLDQLTSLNAVEGHALFCDMRALVTEPVPLPLAEHGLTLLVLDTHAEHAHAGGEYGERRAGCERAAAVLGVQSLRDLTPVDLDSAFERLPDGQLRRYTRHVVTENQRVLDTVDAVCADDYRAVGQLLTASHVSLRDDYRVTVPELDVAVDTLLAAGALGARMTGGGFGGSVIALLPHELCEAAADAVTSRFAEAGFHAPTAMTVSPAQGAHRVEITPA
jgi:galactokinase